MCGRSRPCPSHRKSVARSRAQAVGSLLTYRPQNTPMSEQPLQTRAFDRYPLSIFGVPALKTVQDIGGGLRLGKRLATRISTTSEETGVVV